MLTSFMQVLGWEESRYARPSCMFDIYFLLCLTSLLINTPDLNLESRRFPPRQSRPQPRNILLQRNLSFHSPCPNPNALLRNLLGYASFQGCLAYGRESTACVEYGRSVSFSLLQILYSRITTSTLTRLTSTGYGQHGDYVFGWEGDSLQRAMDNCRDSFGWPEACASELTILSDEEINQCVQRAQVDENIGESECKSCR